MATRNPYGTGGWWLEEQEYAQLLAATTALRAAEEKLEATIERYEGEVQEESVKAEREHKARCAAEAEVVRLRRAVEIALPFMREVVAVARLATDNDGPQEALASVTAALTSSSPLAQAVVDRIAGEMKERAAQRIESEPACSPMFYGRDTLAAAIRALPNRENG